MIDADDTAPFNSSEAEWTAFINSQFGTGNEIPVLDKYVMVVVKER
jgi:hypothetical protein